VILGVDAMIIGGKENKFVISSARFQTSLVQIRRLVLLHEASDLDHYVWVQPFAIG